METIIQGLGMFGASRINGIDLSKQEKVWMFRVLDYGPRVLLFVMAV